LSKWNTKWPTYSKRDISAVKGRLSPFDRLAPFSETFWQEIREKAKDAAEKKLPGKIIATDISKSSVLAARIAVNRSPEQSMWGYYIACGTVYFYK
jgi:hypothetical protein